jgi:hypothetical protein
MQRLSIQPNLSTGPTGDSAYASDHTKTQNYVDNLDTNPRQTKSDFLDHNRVPKYPSTNLYFDRGETDHTRPPIDQSNLQQLNNNKSNVLRPQRQKCAICTMERPNMSKFREEFESCRHDLTVCDICARGHKQMMASKKSRTPEKCPLCYFIDFAMKHETLKLNFADLRTIAPPKTGQGLADPFSAIGARSIMSSRLQLSNPDEAYNLSIGASNTNYTPYMRDEQGLHEIYKRREKHDLIDNGVDIKYKHISKFNN